MKLVHTSTNYSVRVRLDDGDEFDERLVCGLCRVYGSRRDGDRTKAKAVAQALNGTEACSRREKCLPGCLLQVGAAGSVSGR
jgi:hypothetical protein